MFKTFITASGILLLAVSFGMSSCTSNKPEEIKAISSLEELPVLIYEQLESVITDSGKVKYRLFAPTVKQFELEKESYTDFNDGFKFQVYTYKGTLDAEVECNNAKYFKDKQLWELNEDVKAMNEKGEILNTEQLFWDMRTKKLFSDKFVKITTKSEIITGTGFEADENMQNWEINNISGVLEVEE